MSRPTLLTTSFGSPYVSLDLLSYLKSGQVTPFQIFNEVIMPDFVCHISKGKQFLPEIDEKDSSSNSNHEEESYRCNLQTILENIQYDLNYISKACGRLEQWEDRVNDAIKELVFQSLDDAFTERTERLENSVRTNFLQNKLKKTLDIVSSLKESLSPPELSSVIINSESLKLSNFSMNRKDMNNHKVAAEQSTFKAIEAVYNDLNDTLKHCFLCFSAFPENAVIKKKVLVHWWVGEGFIDTLGTEGKTAEETANEFFKVFEAKELIKLGSSANSCIIDPPIRHAVIMLAKKEKFFEFDDDKNPTEDFTHSGRACLVKTEQGSSISELPYNLQHEKVQSMINVNESNLEFRPGWFSKMKNVTVLQLGRWQGSAEHLIQVEDSEFLKGLKNMRRLRYLSLRGVSRITELPASICKLINLRILNLNGCLDLEKLPQGIGALKNLTHLDMYECYLISSMPKGVALLSQLQVLKGFVIGEPTSRSGGQCCKLSDLSRLENLRKLSIHVDNKNKLTETTKSELISLQHFKNLRSLSISWSRLYDIPTKPASFKRRVSEKLASLPKSTTLPRRSAPPTSADSVSSSQLVPFEKLNLHYFPDSEMPDWMMQWKLDKLKKLYIRGGKLSNLCHRKQCQWNVKTVRLKFLEDLDMDWQKLQDLFPELTYLEVIKCPKLISVPCDKNGVWKKEDAIQS